MSEEHADTEGWLEVTAEITRTLLSTADDPLALLVERAVEIVDADLVLLALPFDAESLSVEVAAGVNADAVIGLRPSIADTVTGQAYASGRTLLAGDIKATGCRAVPVATGVAPLGPVMVAPVPGHDGPRGAISFGRTAGRELFSQADLELANAFADHAALALELADARAEQRRAAGDADRTRIARHLQDIVIGRVRSLGSALTEVPAAAAALTDVDRALADLRIAIERLDSQAEAPDPGPRRGRFLPDESAQGSRRRRWLDASTRITRAMWDAAEENPLQVCAQVAMEAADADSVAVFVALDEDSFSVPVAVGQGGSELMAVKLPRAGSVSQDALTAGQALMVNDVRERLVAATADRYDTRAFGPAMVAPLVCAGQPRGTLAFGRLSGRPAFDDFDLVMATAFSHHAGVALELAEARTGRRQLRLRQDRERIARDLNDQVIQRLFATGLGLEAIALGEPDAAAPLREVIGAINEVIVDLRLAIGWLGGTGRAV